MRPQPQDRASRPRQSHRAGLLFVLVIMIALLLSTAAWRASAVSAGAGQSLGTQEGTSFIAGGAACSTPQFQESTRNAIGSIYLHAVEVGDFNKDGKQDFVTASTDCCGQSVWFGDGMGGFPHADYYVLADAGGSVAVAVGDFNNDTNQDFAVANYGSDNVTIRLNNGTGSFPDANAFNVGAGDEPYYVAIGDFNGDDHQDLAVANAGSDNVTIRLGDGTGHFPDANASTISVAGAAWVVAVGDFNHDDKQDLAVGIFESSLSHVTILLGNGMGAFTEAAGSPVDSGGSVTDLAIADFNNDGNQDLVIVSYNNVAAIRLGDGAGGFTNGPSPGVGSTPVSVAVADFNHDGNQDFITANYNSDDVTVRLGDGTGAFPDANSANIHIVGDAPISVAVGDFNNDGKQDFAVANANYNTVVVMLNTCDASPCGNTSFTQPAGSPFATGNSPDSVALGDFNRDGHRDMAVANQTSHNVTIRLGDGAGGFPNTSTVGAGGGPVSIAVGDFNRDGKQDLAVVNFQNDNVTIRLGDGMGGFPDMQATTVDVAHFPNSIAIGDFNRDGKQDLAVTSYAYAAVTLKFGDGMGGFPNTSSVGTSGAPVFVAVGDFNNDGKQDLAVANSGAHSVSVHFGDGMGGFPTSTSTIAQFSPSSIAIGDFNHDGNQDFAVANSSGDNVKINLGNGAGGFPASNTFFADDPQSLAIGDFNGDGKQDLAVTAGSADSVTIRLGDGTGGFPDASATTVGAGDNPIHIVTGDFNHDFKTDIIVTNHNSANVTVLLNTCVPSADLSISKTDMADPVMTNQKINYQLVVTNNGPGSAPAVVLTDTLPAGSTFVSATPSVGSCAQASGTVTCQLGTLANGATATVNIAVKRSTPGTITNTASVSSDQTDPNTSDNQDSESTRVVGFNSFVFTPAMVTGGCQTSKGKLMFTSPAPAGVVIKFADNLAAIAPIAQVVTHGGEMAIQVTAVTSNVSAEQTGTVTASTTTGPNSKQAQLKLLPVKITTLTFNRNPVKGGQHLIGTVRVSCAPDRDLVVRLATNRAVAKPDVTTVTILAGHTSAQFGITTMAVANPTDAIITATLNSIAQRATLHLTP
jgi:uncharacterized repeat protein (TIGR01451 family)